MAFVVILRVAAGSMQLDGRRGQLNQLGLIHPVISGSERREEEQKGGEEPTGTGWSADLRGGGSSVCYGHQGGLRASGLMRAI